jgi:hypothetical protein
MLSVCADKLGKKDEANKAMKNFETLAGKGNTGTQVRRK